MTGAAWDGLTVGRCGLLFVLCCRRAGLGLVLPRCCKAGPSVTRGELGRSTKRGRKIEKERERVGEGGREREGRERKMDIRWEG